MATVLASGFGGALTTYLPSGTDFPWPAFLQRFLRPATLLELLANFLRNIILGAVASFLVWALANPTQDFTETAVTVGQVASAIIVGGTGGTVINSFFRHFRETSVDSKTMERLVEALRPEENGNG